MTKAADIMAAATPGRMKVAFGGSGAIFTDDDWNDATVEVYGERYGKNARAIVTAVNLFPLYEAVREAARAYLWSPDSFDDYDPADVPDDEWAPEALALRVALDALQAAEDAL